MNKFFLLNDKEFAIMCGKLIQIREGALLEQFGAGKDGGIDFRGVIDGKLTIIQVKHISNYNTLKSTLKNKELKKIQKLKPERYILMVSMDLNVSRKDEILEIFKDYITDNTDFINGADIASYLDNSKYKSVLNYFKQKAIINLVGTSDEDINENPFKNCFWLYDNICEIKKYFIETKIFNDAKKNIKDNNVVVLTGDAGAGKTTNAKMLLDYILNVYQIDEVIVINSVLDFFKYYDKRKKQIFFFDDFWGHTFNFNYFERNEERNLNDVFECINKSENSYLIMTTREYVFKQGVNYYHLNNNIFKNRIFFLNSKFSDLEKVKILISHILNSNLDFNVISVLITNSEKIIDYPNYSPRIIASYISTHQDDVFKNTFDFFYRLCDYLKSPRDYFESVFYKLSEGARIIAYIMAISNPPVYMNRLLESFKVFVNSYNNDIKISRFDIYVHELENSFTKYDCMSDSIEFENYSIHDFINDCLIKELDDYRKPLLKSIIYFNQYYNILLSDKINLNKDEADILISRLMKVFDDVMLISIDGTELNIIKDTDSAYFWYGEKIWHSILIAEKYNDNLFLEFLASKVLNMISYYERNNHSFNYYRNNFINIPELLKKFNDLNYSFNYDEISIQFLKGWRYIYELSCVKLGPTAFKIKVKNEFNKIKNDFIMTLSKRLNHELNIFSIDGIDLEYNITVDELKNICDFFDILYGDDIEQILKKKKISFDDFNIKFKDNSQNETNKYIKKVHDSLYNDTYLSKEEIIKEVKRYKFSDDFFNKFFDMYGDKKYSILCEGTSLEYLDLLLDYFKVTSDIDFSWNLYPKLIRYIVQTTGINEKILYNYANYKMIHKNTSLSKKHLTSLFNISDEQIDYLIKIGVFKKQYNMITFSNLAFEVYLSIMFIIGKKSKDYKIYKRYFKNCSSFYSYIYVMFEYFDTESFNNNFFNKVCEYIISEGFDNFKGKLLNMEIETDFDGSFTYFLPYDEKYIFYNDLLLNFFGEDIFDSIGDFIINSKYIKTYKDNKINVNDFYKLISKNERESFNNMLLKYYNLAKETRENISILKEHEKFEI